MYLEFEWDEGKQRTNRKKHKLGFEEGQSVFDDDYALTVTDPRHEEPRFKTTGMAGSRMLTVIWTPRESRIRLISVRSASRAERRAYRSLHGE
jgi:uncharacterized protein